MYFYTPIKDGFGAGFVKHWAARRKQDDDDTCSLIKFYVRGKGKFDMPTNKTPFTFHLEEEYLEKLRYIAKQETRSVSNLLEQLCRSYIKEYEQGTEKSKSYICKYRFKFLEGQACLKLKRPWIRQRNANGTASAKDTRENDANRRGARRIAGIARAAILPIRAGKFQTFERNLKNKSFPKEVITPCIILRSGKMRNVGDDVPYKGECGFTFR